MTGWDTDVKSFVGKPKTHHQSVSSLTPLSSDTQERRSGILCKYLEFYGNWQIRELVQSHVIVII